MASLRSHRRVDKLRGDALASGLVGDKSLEFSERPTSYHPVEMLVPCPDAGTDAFEVFHADRFASVLDRFHNDDFAQVVVLPGNPSSLFSRQPFQDAPCARSAFGLKRRTYSPEFFFDCLDISSAELLAVGQRGDVANAEINAEGGSGFGNFVGVLDDDVDEPLMALFDDRCSSRTLPNESVSLKLSEDKRDMNATADGGERNSLVLSAIIEYAGIVVDTCWQEFRRIPPPMLTCGQCLRNSANGADNEVGGKPTGFLNRFVGQMMNLDIVMRSVLNGHSKNVVASIRKYPAGLVKRFRHYGCWSHFAFNCSLAHGDIYSIMCLLCQEKLEDGIPPSPLGGGLLPYCL